MQNAYPSLHKLQSFFNGKSTEGQKVAEVPTQAMGGQTLYRPKVVQPQAFTSQNDYMKA